MDVVVASKTLWALIMALQRALQKKSLLRYNMIELIIVEGKQMAVASDLFIGKYALEKNMLFGDAFTEVATGGVL